MEDKFKFCALLFAKLIIGNDILVAPNRNIYISSMSDVRLYRCSYSVIDLNHTSI